LEIVAGATNDFVMNIAFSGEQAISVDFGGAATATTYTLQAIVDKINLASNNPSTAFDDDGTSFGYSAASIVETSAGEFKIQLEARSSAATSVAITATNAQTAGAVLGVFGATYTAAGVMTGAALFQEWDAATTDWVSDAAGGAGAGLNILTSEAAIAALTTIGDAINTKDAARAGFGYKMNRLESTIAILDIQAENLMAAESRISDVDVATEMATLTRTQVLSQAGISMLAQANQMPQMALSLLR
jgi:flagellin-like hook-associated protein FlgL